MNKTQETCKSERDLQGVKYVFVNPDVRKSVINFYKKGCNCMVIFDHYSGIFLLTKTLLKELYFVIIMIL